MNEKPTPTAASMAALAAAWRDEQMAQTPPGILEANPHFKRYADLGEPEKTRFREQMLPVLAAALPQIAADVLHHAADELNLVSAHEWTHGDCVNWLRRQAEAVLT